MSGTFAPPAVPVPPPASRKEGVAPPRLIAIGASTGGPPAINRILVNLEPTLPVGIVITQHMPTKFTRAFAERLDRTTPWSVREAEQGDALSAGCVLVAPGSGSLVLKKEGTTLRVEIMPPQPDDRYVPSVDRMLSTAAAAMGGDLLGIVLTGMGGDGGRGVKAVKAAGGRNIAEAPETAVIFGMPQEAIATGAVDEVVALPNIPDAIARFASKK